MWRDFRVNPFECSHSGYECPNHPRQKNDQLETRIIIEMFVISWFGKLKSHLENMRIVHVKYLEWNFIWMHTTFTWRQKILP